MPDWIDTPEEFLTIVTITAAFFAALLWLIKAQVAQMKEMQPNGGSTMRDAINRIEQRQISIQERLDHHINWHLEDK